MAGPRRKSRHKLDTRKGLVKYNSDYALILQLLLASARRPCKSVCKLLGLSCPFPNVRPRTYGRYALSAR